MNRLQALQTASNPYPLFAQMLRELNPIDYGHYYPLDWQYSDWEFLDVNHHACLVRAPGGSKTFDMVLWVILQKILHPEWKVAWLASQGGQLIQSRIYFEQNPFVKVIRQVQGYDRVYLWNGTYIHFRNTSKSISGIRLDIVVLDEEEMLDPHQIEIVYPQIDSRLSVSSVDKFIHLGTMQTGSLFQEHTERYPTRQHIWTDCPWLIAAGKIQREIDDGITPRHIIDMLYYCIPSSPGGAILPRIIIGTVPINTFSFAGIDHGNIDTCVLTYAQGNTLYVMGEYERVLLDNHGAFDFLLDITRSIEVEGGGYNDDAHYDAKASLLAQRLGATKQSWTHKWAKQRLLKARSFEQIIIDPQLTPNTYKDLKNGQYDPRDGNIWYKHPSKAPCHYLDAFMHSLHISGQTYIASSSITPSLRQREKDREARLQY